MAAQGARFRALLLAPGGGRAPAAAFQESWGRRGLCLLPGAPKTMKKKVFTCFHLQKTWFLGTKNKVFDGFGWFWVLLVDTEPTPAPPGHVVIITRRILWLCRRCVIQVSDLSASDGRGLAERRVDVDVSFFGVVG